METQEWWKSSEFVGVETWDIPKIIAEAVRRRDAELLEKVERFKNEIVLSPDIADKTKWNVLEWVIKLIKGE